MNAILMALLSSFGPALLSKLFGGQSSQEKEAQRLLAEKQASMDKIRALYDPAYRASLVKQNYQQNISSPAYSQAQGTIAAGANQAASQIASSLGQTGLTSSGTGAIMSGVIPSMVGHNLAGLKTSAWNSAGPAADQSIEGQVSAIMRTLGVQGAPAGPSQTSQYAAMGMDAFSKFLLGLLTKPKVPQVAGLPSGNFNQPWNWAFPKPTGV
jgi:hypothetical protein